jgi:LCP family protein required for cell wall assembly
MRTTLKRGIGRGAALNGNGNGNGRAVLPPGYLSPVTRYRQPERSHGFARVLAKGLVWLLIGLVVVISGLLGGVALYADREVVQKLRPTDRAVIDAAEELEAVPAGEPAIALVVGYDKRLGAEAEVTGRSDTIMLVRADPDTNSLSMLSFPRDLKVDVHCPGRVFRERINAAFSECGIRGTLETVRQLTGLPLNYLVTVNYRGFKQMVAKLGGVWIDVDRRYYTAPGTGYAPIDLEPGYQKLSGQKALDFVRYRRTDSDLYRNARQQLFVQAFKQAVTASFGPKAIAQIVDVITDNVQVAKAGNDEFSRGELISYGLFVYRHPQFFQSKIDFSCYGEDDLAQLTVDAACVRKAVGEFAHPDVEAPEKATQVALGLKPKEPALAPKDTSVLVLNGNGVPGIAANTSFELAQRGYATRETANGSDANAPTQDYLRSVVYYDSVRKPLHAAAKKLATLLGDADVEPLPQDAQILAQAGDAMLVAVLGQNFPGSIVPAPVDQTPERQPPAVATNPDLTADWLRRAQRQVRFPVYVPTKVESTSFVPDGSPPRVYKIAGHPTIRLTFSTGASEYWGVQMVRWNAAPALRNPSRKVTRKGRHYELHYQGAKLHMVVLREQGTTYWVVNTILNTLSNETMLAIAEGLKPLRTG